MSLMANPWDMFNFNTVLHRDCCIAHYVANSDVDISKYRLFAKQMNLQEYLLHKHYVPKGFYWYKNVNLLE